MPSPRPQKVASLIRTTVAELLPQVLRTEKFGLVTVTDVALTRGLEQATIFVTVLKNKHQLEEEVAKHVYELQQLVNERIVMRRVPKLIFRLDDTAGLTEKLAELTD